MPDAPILWHVLQHGKALRPVPSHKSYIIPQDILEHFGQNLRRQIQVGATRMAKRATRSLDALSSVRIYQRGHGMGARKTALLSELFRTSPFISNAGYLNIEALYNKLYDAVISRHPMTLEIAWGQAKRDAGLLRTPGPGADIAELFAIGRLISLVRAVELLICKPVNLRVVTEGLRFWPALFNRLEEIKAYDTQRQTFAHWLDSKLNTEFCSIERYWSQEEIILRLHIDEQQAVEHPPREKDFRFALFAVDWYSIFQTDTHPYNALFDETCRQSLSLYSHSQRVAALRAALAKIANQSIDLSQSNTYLSHEILSSLATGISKVAKVAATRYRRLGRITKRDMAISTEDECPVLITVIEKPHKSELPVIQLLGRKHGSTLPQHVAGWLTKAGDLTFGDLYLSHAVHGKLYASELSDAPLLMTAASLATSFSALQHLRLFRDWEIA